MNCWEFTFSDHEGRAIATYFIEIEGDPSGFQVICDQVIEEPGLKRLGDRCASGIFYAVDGSLVPDIIRVEEPHRRRGIATTLCEIAQEFSCLPWGEPEALLPDGEKFWPAYCSANTNRASAGS